MANTQTIVGLNCSTQTAAQRRRGSSLAPGLTSRGAGWWTDPYGWLRPSYTNERPSTGAPLSDRVPGLTIRRSGGVWMAAIKTTHQIHRFPT